MKLSAARVLLLLSGRKGFWKNFSDNLKVILKHCFKSPKTYKGYIKNQFRNNVLLKAAGGGGFLSHQVMVTKSGFCEAIDTNLQIRLPT